ncbi:MAG: DUF2203 domain-containing protein [Nitrospinaceae bacterium]|nr:MAG: DUF2203 domain-containing protein [Nitrospinaceae bacterium]
MMPEKRYFTLEEANALVPDLLRDVPKIQGLTHHLSHDFPDVKKAWEKAKYNGGSLEGVSYLKGVLQLNALVKSLESRGCILKGASAGLVDFLSMRDGREVYLCWKLPEKDIRYWHDLDAGFAGRQEI